MAGLRIRPQAERDLDEIWWFIAQDDPDAADAWIDQLVSTARTLADNPGMGRSRDELMPGIRSFSVGDYVLFYLPVPNSIELVRVLNGYRDLSAVFP